MPQNKFQMPEKGCNKEHTLLHPPPSEPGGGGTNQSQLSREDQRLDTTDGSNCTANSQEEVSVAAERAKPETEVRRRL